MPTAPIRESPSARQTEDGPAAAASGPGDGESLAHTIGASATTTEATTENVDTLEAETAADVDVSEAVTPQVFSFHICTVFHEHEHHASLRELIAHET